MSPKSETKVTDAETGEQLHIVKTTFTPDLAVPAVSLDTLMQQYGLSGPLIKADQLIDQRFTIVRAKPFQSSYSEDAHAYFCTCRGEDGEVFTTVLGGQAVVDIIDLLSSLELKEPVIVTLRWHDKAGKYSGYYSLE